jgi:hypothetical protein
MCFITIYFNLRKDLYRNIRLDGYWLWRHIVTNPTQCTHKEFYHNRVLMYASLFRFQYLKNNIYNDKHANGLL